MSFVSRTRTRTLFALILIAALVFSSVSGLGSQASAATTKVVTPKLSITLDGKALTLSPAPVKKGNSIYVEFISIFKAFGLSPVYDEDGAVVYQGDTRISLKYGKLIVDGVSIKVSAEPYYSNKKWFLPLDSVARSLAATYTYTAKTNLVQLKKAVIKPAEVIYGFNIPMTDFLKTYIIGGDSLSMFTLASKFPLTDGKEFYFHIQGIVHEEYSEVDGSFPFFSIKVFKKTEAQWKAMKLQDYIYIGTKNGYTLAYSLTPNNAQSYRKYVQELGWSEGGAENTISEENFAALEQIYEQLPGILAQTTIVTSKPATSTLPSYRSYEGTYTASGYSPVVLKFVSDRAAIVTWGETTMGIAEIDKTNRGNPELYVDSDVTFTLVDGRLVFTAPVVSEDGEYWGDQDVFFTKKK